MSGSINQNSTWTLSGSPYVLDGTVTVNSGVTLTLEPGVIVKGRSTSYGLYVNGTLDASGTAEAPITFTSYKDDAVGGDTNGDGGSSSPAAGNWAGLRVGGGAVATLEHAAVCYAGYSSWSYAAIYVPDNGSLSVSDSQILDSVTYGIYAASAPASFTLQGNTIARCGGYGVSVIQPSQPVTLTNNTIRDGGSYAIELKATAAAASLSKVTLAGNTIAGNRYNAISLNGTVRSDWHLPAYPENDAACYRAAASLSVSPGATLTLDPGVVFKSSGGIGLTISGALDAQGTAERPIVFTSFYDDTAAGDTNADGSASAPSKGSWAGLSFGGGTSGTLDHVAVRWAGGGYQSPAISLSGSPSPSLSLTNSEIAHNGGEAVQCGDGPTAFTLHNCTLADNDQVAVIVNDPQHPVTLTNNTIRDGGSYAIELKATAAAASLSKVTLAGNTIAGNRRNAITLRGVVRSNWHPPAYPEEDQVAYLATLGLEIAAGATLTLDPGTVMKVDNYDLSYYERSKFHVLGALDAQGTAERPIVFTSHRDDTFAGDTNGDGDSSSPSLTSWEGLTFYDAGAGILDHVVLHWAGSRITRYTQAAIYASSGTSVAIHNSDISANAVYGIWAPSDGSASVHAENNWWGSGSGPFPYGTNNAIAYHIATDPWGRQYVVPDVAADPWLGQTMWDGPTLGACGYCGYDADPVNVSTGNYTYEATDVSVPTRGPALEVVRTYNSQLAQDSPFGYGWAFSYNLRVEEKGTLGGTDRYVAVTREDGGQIWYRVEGGDSYAPPPGVHDVLTSAGDGTYRLTTKEHIVYAFDAGGRLASVTDRNGNASSVSYGANGISAVTAPDGRSLTFTCDAAGHVTEMSDPAGRNWSYGYDEDDNLTSVTEPGGGVTRYTCDGKHRLLTLVDANGHTALTNTYDAQTGRVATQSDASGNLTTFTYDLASGKTYVRNPLGKTTTYVSNSRHCLLSVTTPRGGTTYSSYDNDNNKIEATDPLGRTTYYTYDSRGNLLTTMNAADDVATLTYDARNNPLTKTDFAGHEWAYEYDGNGNLTEATDPLDHVTSSTYDAYGQIESSTDARGKTTLYHHNARGDLTWTETPNGHRTTAEYDAVGRKTSETTARGKTTTYAYDDVNRVTTTTDPLSHQGKTYYDAVGNKIRVRDARGHDATFTYDACNNQISVTVAEGTAAEATTTYTYDAKNRLASFTDANDHTTTYAYDDDGNRIRRTDPRGRARSQTFDLAGNLISATDAKNQTTSYAYDLLNRLTTITKPGSVTVGFTYDEVGNRLTTVDSRGTTTYTYNAVGWLTSVTTPDGDEVAYSYYADGKRHTLAYPDDREAEYVYNDDGELTAITGPAGDTTAYTYYADGSLHTTNLPNGITGTDVYDDAGRLSSITYSDGGTLLSIAYTRNNNGAPTAIGDSRLGQSTYTYDALDQLTSETRGGSTTNYTYDGVGNRLTKTVDGVTTSYSYSAANELTSAGGTSYTYDANGSRVAKTQGSETITYSFNSDNLLTGTSSTATATSYIYDGENQRIAAIEDDTRTDFVLDSAVGDEVVLQETTGEDVATLTYGAGLISRETSDGIRYLLADGLGSVRLETDEDGDIVREHSYEAFGSELGSPDLTGNRFRFTGQWSDPAGLVFLRARFYDPETGTFLSIDPVPTASSLYMYCSNNPLFRVDPSGMIDWSPAWQGFANCMAGVADSFASLVGRHVGQPYYGPGLTASYRIGQYVVGPAAQLLAGSALAKGAMKLASVATAARARAAGQASVTASRVPGSRVFWCGGSEAKAAAQSFAKASGGVTLDMTAKGRALETATAGMDYVTQAKPLWRAASLDFAQGAAGDAHVFVNTARFSDLSLFYETEYNALLQNRNVTDIIFHFL